MGDHVPLTDRGKDRQDKLGVVSISDHDSVVAADRKHHSGHRMAWKVHHREGHCMVCFHAQKDVDHSMDHDTFRHKDLQRASLCTDLRPGGNMGHHKVLVEGIQGAQVLTPAWVHWLCHGRNRNRSSFRHPYLWAPYLWAPYP